MNIDECVRITQLYVPSYLLQNALHVKGGKGVANELASLLCAGTHRFSPGERLSFINPFVCFAIKEDCAKCKGPIQNHLYTCITKLLQ